MYNDIYVRLSNKIKTGLVEYNLNMLNQFELDFIAKTLDKQQELIDNSDKWTPEIKSEIVFDDAVIPRGIRFFIRLDKKAIEIEYAIEEILLTTHIEHIINDTCSKLSLVFEQAIQEKVTQLMNTQFNNVKLLSTNKIQ